MKDLPPLGRAPLLVLGFAALAMAAAGGMVRLGIVLAAPPMGIAWHGALMASAFFATLISLERAVAMGRLWGYAAPLACGCGGVALLLGSAGVAFALFVIGAALFSVVSFLLYLKQRALHTAALVLGALALLTSNLVLAAGGPLAAAVLGWVAFFTLTIGGERLELSRIARPPLAARRAFAVICALLLAAALAAPWATDAMVRAVGLLLVATALWLWRYDIATRTVRARGLTRYIALCLLAGYVWLAFGGALLALAGAMGARELWDAALHSVMLGFVFSMVFGHAPVILPAVLRVPLPYHPLLYAPLGLLHATLALRAAADLAGSAALRAWGGAGNVTAIALFIVTAASLSLFGRTRTH